MKKLALLALLPFNAMAMEYNWEVLRVVDGDTVEVKQEFLPEELRLYVRILGIDTPEKKSKCASEVELAHQASAITTEIFNVAKKNHSKITFKKIKWDKYGGRIDAEIWIDDRNMSTDLIAMGVARKYDGGTKQSWCVNGE